MRNLSYLSRLLGILCIFISKNSFSQVANTDSSSLYALNNTLRIFNASIDKQSPIYNGAEYNFYDPTISGNAYFSDLKAFSNGSITYDQVFFAGIPMLYDIYSDQVIVLLFDHYTKFSLVKEKVFSFDYLDHHFINIAFDTSGNNVVMKSGYYDELYSGHIHLLVKRYKNLQRRESVNLYENYFNYEKDYFIKKNNVYYGFSSQGALLDILKDKKKELQKFIKTNQIKYRSDPENAMVKITTYYDHLTN